MEDESKPCPLTEKYKVKKEDDDSKNWVSLLDFESPIKVESDWYSTQTFQVFLDALDINQPTCSKSGKLPISNGSSSAIGPSDTTTTPPPQTINNDKHDKQQVMSRQDKDKMANRIKHHDKPRHQQQNNFETILSAEALKILSDLPDLSHMSATRSFIFPATTAESNTTKFSQKTKIKSGKR